MIKERLIGENVNATVQKDSFIVPHDIDKGHTVLITTTWDNTGNIGKTTRFVVPLRSYWKIREPELLKRHESVGEALDFHEQITAKEREARNG